MALPLRVGVVGCGVARTVQVVSFEEAFTRELVKSPTPSRRAAGRADVIEGLHDIALCKAIATSHITGKPVGLPSALPDSGQLTGCPASPTGAAWSRWLGSGV